MQNSQFGRRKKGDFRCNRMQYGSEVMRRERGPQILPNAGTVWLSAGIYPALIDVWTNTGRIRAGAFYCPLYGQTCKRSEKLGTLMAHRVKGKQLLSKIKEDIHRLSVEICQSEELYKTGRKKITRKKVFLSIFTFFFVEHFIVFFKLVLFNFNIIHYYF